MRFAPLVLTAFLLAGSIHPLVAEGHKHRSARLTRMTSSRSSHSSLAKSHLSRKAHLSSQRSIDDQRATEIQQALIKAGYLTGEPSGHWDTGSEAAMQKLQADNGWQTKLVPDSRALIKLGLGPGAPAAAQPAPASSTSIATTASGTFADSN